VARHSGAVAGIQGRVGVIGQTWAVYWLRVTVLGTGSRHPAGTTEGAVGCLVGHSGWDAGIQGRRINWSGVLAAGYRPWHRGPGIHAGTTEGAVCGLVCHSGWDGGIQARADQIPATSTPTVSFNRRFAPQVQKIKELLAGAPIARAAVALDTATRDSVNISLRLASAQWMNLRRQIGATRHVPLRSAERCSRMVM